MRNLMLISGLLLMCSTGCVRSLHPLYTEHDVVFDPNLIGFWSMESGESLEFSKLSEKEYHVVYKDPREQGAGTATFVGHLVKIEGSLFMDLFPKEPDQNSNPNPNPLYRSHFVPVHSFAQVIQIEPTLQIRSLDIDWLHKITKDNPQAIRHEKIGRDIVLTASTKELQTFLLNHLETEDAFEEPCSLQRVLDTVPRN